jgi:hypothetical protein
MLSLIPETLLGNLVAQPVRSPAKELLDLDLLTPEFQRELQGQMQTTMTKMKQRSALAKYLQELEVVRGED